VGNPQTPQKSGPGAPKTAPCHGAAIGTDKCGQNYNASIDKKARNLTDAADIFLAVIGPESQVRIQPVANIVTVKNEGMDSA